MKITYVVIVQGLLSGQIAEVYSCSTLKVANKLKKILRTEYNPKAYITLITKTKVLEA